MSRLYLAVYTIAGGVGFTELIVFAFGEIILMYRLINAVPCNIFVPMPSTTRNPTFSLSRLICKCRRMNPFPSIESLDADRL